MDDKELLLLLDTSPQDGIRKLADLYGSLVWSVAYGKLSGRFGREDIEECVSDVFVDIFDGREHISLEKGSLKTYICVIARRKAAQKYKKLIQKQSLPLTEEFPITKNEYEQIENRSVLLQCIKELGEPDSHIFIMKYYLGYSTKMIAEKFDLKQNTVDKKVQRGLEKLKKALQGGVFYE